MGGIKLSLGAGPKGRKISRAKYSTSQARFQYIFLRDHEGENGREKNWEHWGEAQKGSGLSTSDWVCCSGALPHPTAAG